MNFQDIKSYAENCIRDYPPPCACACPFVLDVRAFIDRVAKGKYSGALRLYSDAVLFPGTVSRLCPAYCGDFCVRGGFDSSVDIRLIERGVLENVKRAEPVRYAIPPKNTRVAVIGAGLSGLSCAYRLAGKGYIVTVFEASGNIGGAAVKSLPEGIADADFQSAFKYIGYELRLNERIKDINEVHHNFDAIYVSTGKEGNDFGLLPSWNSKTLTSSMQGVFAGGSLTDCPPIWSIENGLRAASSIEEFLKTGRNDGVGLLYDRPPVNDKFYEIKYDFHAPAPADVSYIDEAKRCPMCNCSLCIDACPLMEYYKTNPKRIAADLGVTVLPVEGKIKHVASRMLNSCNLCGLCDAVCPAGVETFAAMFESRRMMSDSGNIPAAFHDFWLADMQFSFSDSAYAVIGPESAGSGLLFFPGCQLAASSPHAAEAAYKYIKSIRPDASMMLSCCGIPAAWAAESDMLAQCTEKIRAEWLKLGCPDVLFACSSCMQNFEQYLPEIKGRLVYEWLALNDGELCYPNYIRDSLDSGDSAADLSGACVFDPCSSRTNEAGRTAVRRLAEKSGFSLSELDLSGPKAACCGFGGHIYPANPSLLSKVINERTYAAESTYITYCANCRDFFLHEGKDSLHILDILFAAEVRVKLPGFSERRQNRAALKERFTGVLSKPRVPAVTLDIPDAILKKMNGLLLLNEDAEDIVARSELTGAKLINPDNDRFTAYGKSLSVTIWVEYEMHSKTQAVLHNIYSHRMNIKPGTRGEPHVAGIPDESGLICAKCRIPLEKTETKFEYLKHEFSHAIPKCPICDRAYISEELVLGKMLEVETMLEDK
ncbi:MAG: FAD-dependent oxidoreductase [Clostridiales Family XIII bacterium]|jgi:NADPH-dependent glutamate synthase beta subunit-like oxidoreductase|nr:FAD-dependent oxidoreductase [Clostridiales Family XIII bacterium]